MKTFLIKTVQENEGVQRVQETKVSAGSLAELIACLKKYNINPLWDTNNRIREIRDDERYVS
jgi:hypothetical protein